jgi:PAS domain S-box-containing protein
MRRGLSNHLGWRSLALLTGILRERVARALHEQQERRFRALIEHSSDAIALVDPAGTILYASPSTERVLGYTAGEFGGRNGLELVHPDEREEVMRSLSELLQSPGETVTAQVRVQHKDGRWRWMESMGTNLLHEPGVRAVVVNYRDITERKRTEEERARLLGREQAAHAATEAERSRLQQVLDVLPEGILITDTTGRFVVTNAAAKEIIGLELLGQPIAVSDQDAFGARHLDGSPYPSGGLPLQRSLLHGEVVRGEQLLVRNAATGRDVPILVSSAPLRDAAGAIVGGVAVFQDISAIKDIERARDDFVSSVSHDLKTPLTIIKALTQMLQRGAARASGPNTEQLVAGLARIDAMTTKMTVLINQFLDVTHLQMGQSLPLHLRPTDLVALPRQVAAERQQTTEQHRIRVESVVPELVGTWDGFRLERVLANLLSNAIKYSPHGGDVTVRVAREEDAAGGWAVLTVHDQGIGIPAEDLPYVFDRLYRAGNVVGHMPGTGIGLAGARQIVEQHGGSIAVESQEGAGATFTVRLPLAQPDAGRAAPS